MIEIVNFMCDTRPTRQEIKEAIDYCISHGCIARLHYTNDLSDGTDLKAEAIAAIESIVQYMDEDELLHHSRPLALAYLALTEEVDVAPVVRAKWITRSDKGIISITHPYMCSRCWRVEMNKEPYCNCGAKMDGDNVL